MKTSQSDSVQDIISIGMNTVEKISLSNNNLKGFINLLIDSEEKTLSLMAQQLGKFDDKSLRVIEEVALNSEDEILIDNWYYITRLCLVQEIKDWKKTNDLEEGLFLISKLRNPGVEISKCKAQLDSYAERIKARLRPSSTDDEIIAAMNQVLFREEAFVGNQVDYYDLNNNFLHTVLECRAGNPIMLSAIYILVAKRLGLEIKGIGTPGHFIVKFKDQLLDPFFAGREVSREECVLRAQELNVFWREEYIEPIDDLFLISRAIRNLISIYKQQNEFDRAADATAILKMV